MPWLPSSSSSVSASSSKALSSSKDPWTNRTLLASWSHTSSRHGVRAALRAASRASSANSPSPQSRRANPSSAKFVGSRPRLARSYTAGSSFFRARSPVIPKTTRAQGSGTRGSRRSRGSRSGLVIIAGRRACEWAWSVLEVGRRPRRPARRRMVQCRIISASRGSGLRLELLADRLGQVVPGVHELLDRLLLEDAEHVVEVHAGVGHGLQDRGGGVVGLLHGRARFAVV